MRRNRSWCEQELHFLSFPEMALHRPSIDPHTPATLSLSPIAHTERDSSNYAARFARRRGLEDGEPSSAWLLGEAVCYPQITLILGVVAHAARNNVTTRASLAQALVNPFRADSPSSLRSFRRIPPSLIELFIYGIKGGDLRAKLPSTLEPAGFISSQPDCIWPFYNNVPKGIATFPQYQTRCYKYTC